MAAFGTEVVDLGAVRVVVVDDDDQRKAESDGGVEFRKTHHEA
jgi:hypothetical protein